MDLGTAKPSPDERARFPHHLIDVADPDQPFTAGAYSRAARALLSEISCRGRLPIVTGGTGLYLRALTEGLFAGPGATGRPALASAAKPRTARSRMAAPPARPARSPISRAHSRQRHGQIDSRHRSLPGCTTAHVGGFVARSADRLPAASHRTQPAPPAAVRTPQPAMRRNVCRRTGGGDARPPRTLWPSEGFGLARIPPVSRCPGGRDDRAAKPSPPPSRAIATTPSGN